MESHVHANPTPQFAKGVIFATMDLPYRGWTPVIMVEGSNDWIKGQNISLEGHENWFMFSIKSVVPSSTVLKYLLAMKTAETFKTGSMFLAEKVRGRPNLRKIDLIPGKSTVVSLSWGVDEDNSEQIGNVNGVLFRAYASNVGTTYNDKLWLCGSEGTTGKWQPGQSIGFTPLGYGSHIAHANFDDDCLCQYKLIRGGYVYRYTRPYPGDVLAQICSIEFRASWEGEPFHNKSYHHTQTDGLVLHVTKWDDHSTKTFDLDKITTKVNIPRQQLIEEEFSHNMSDIALPDNFTLNTECYPKAALSDSKAILTHGEVSDTFESATTGDCVIAKVNTDLPKYETGDYDVTKQIIRLPTDTNGKSDMADFVTDILEDKTDKCDGNDVTELPAAGKNKKRGSRFIRFIRKRWAGIIH